MAVTLVKPHPMVAAERCDRCNAGAKVLASKNGSVLFFCGHHSNALLTALLNSGWEVEH